MKLILQAIKALFRKIEASRTHWDTRKFVTKDYTFDGNIDGKETIQIREGTLLVKVDDTFPEVSSITNLLVAYTDISEGSVEEYELSLGDVSMEGDIYSFDGDAYYTPHGGEYEGVYIPSGLYFRYHIDVVYVSKLSVTNVYGELKKLDKKYMPDEVIDGIDTITSKMDANNPVGTGSFSMGRKPDTVVGADSHAEGSNTTASGTSSHAEGESTTASGYSSHAEGVSTTASGARSHAEGVSTTASGARSHAEGEDTTASGTDSHAEGYYTKALSDYSHTEGYYTTASGGYSHAEGSFTTASGSSSHAEGESTNRFLSVVTTTNSTDTDIITAWKNTKFSLAKGISSHVEGKDNLALGSYSHAEGNYTTALGGPSHAEGFYTTASRDYSHAEGYYTTASGGYSHAEGSSTTASGNNSHAEGSSTTASGVGSHAEGSGTTALGTNSYAGGYNTTASGQSSHAEGSSTNKFSSVVTKTNPTNNDIITAWGSKKFSVAKGSGSHVEGTDNLALGDSSHAEGYITTASGNDSHTEGHHTTALNYADHAEGHKTTASGGRSHAEGWSTTASGGCSHAEGANTKASSSYQHAQGKFNIADSAGTYADIIGNGTSDTARSNAATVDWSGNAWYAGDVYVGSTSGTNKDAGSKKLATEEYVSTELENYTPDPSLGITNATVGQIAKITAVDSNGKPTAWEPVDLPTENALRLVVDTTTTEDVAQIEFTEDIDGNPLKLKKFIFNLEVPAATGAAASMIGVGVYRWLSGADTPQTGSYGGKEVSLSTSKTTWWGELCLNIEADGKFAILYKRATNVPYSNNTANSDGGTYHRLDVRYAPYSSGGGNYYFHETIDRIFYKSGSTTVMIPTGTKIKIWGVDA